MSWFHLSEPKKALKSSARLLVHTPDIFLAVKKEKKTCDRKKAFKREGEKKIVSRIFWAFPTSNEGFIK